jgi:Mg2+/citrate symporter
MMEHIGSVSLPTLVLMKSLRSPAISYFAAFLLGATIALLLNWPARAEPIGPVSCSQRM